MPATSRSRWTLARTDGRGRFVAGVLGAVVASLVWVVGVLVVATTPEEARDRRAVPDLPMPTARLQSQVLRQVTWYPCDEDDDVVSALAPSVPEGQRSVVTGIARGGTPVRTGVRAATVGSVPVVAVVTNGVLFRDLSVGDTGPDVRAFTLALRRAGIIPRAQVSMDAATVAAWHAAADPDGPPDRVRIETIVTVPRPGVVQSVGVGPGDVVRPGTPLAEIGAGSEGYVCGVPDPEGQITPSSATLQVDGRAVEVESVMTRLRTRQEPGSVTVVPKNTRVRGSARLGIAAVATDEAVLTAPLSAVRTAPDGRTIVNVVEGDDRRVTTVTLGVSAQGWVEVRGRGLREGDAVELFDEASAAGSATDGAEPTS